MIFTKETNSSASILKVHSAKTHRVLAQMSERGFITELILNQRSTLTFRLGLPQDTQHLSIGGVLAQGPQYIPTLPIGDLHLSSWGPVKQRKGLFELCREKTKL
jgi:hypothetical protein